MIYKAMLDLKVADMPDNVLDFVLYREQREKDRAQRVSKERQEIIERLSYLIKNCQETMQSFGA